jgi:hypothetical protein
MRYVSRLLIAFTILFNLPSSLRAETPPNQVINGDFTENLDHWDDCCGNIAWSSEDSAADLGIASDSPSGSVQIDNPQAISFGGGHTAEQCLELNADQKYFLSAAILIPENQGIGEASVFLRCWDADQCSGNHSDVMSFIEANQEKKGKWIAYGVYVTTPEDAKSCTLTLWAGKNTEGAFTAFFDRVGLNQSGPSTSDNSNPPANGSSASGCSLSNDTASSPGLLGSMLLLGFYFTLKISLRQIRMDEIAD